MKHEIKLSYNGYKYAPESFNFFVNGKLYAAAYTQEAAKLGYLIITGKEKEARDEIKRAIRKGYKKPEYITIGYYQEGSATRYFFTRQLYARRDNLQEKLRIYKEYKHFIEARNGIVNTYEVKSGQFVPGKAAAAQTQIIEEKADLNRPIIIHLK